MPLLRIVLGLAVLFLGRRLFWLFVGLAGFLFGVDLVASRLAGQPDWVVLALALAIGVGCAVLAVLLERVAFGVGGFLAGGYVTSALLAAAGLSGDALTVLALAGGVAGAVLAVALMDWALIVLSALTGAAAVVQGAGLARGVDAAVFVLLAVVGVAVQGALYHRSRARGSSSRE